MCECGKTKCCCIKTISKQGLKGPRGPQGPRGPIGPPGGITAIIVKNTVFVSKNGNDATGLAERFDKPFLTLAAARVAAVALIPSAVNRILIKLEKGTYMEPIDLANFVDWDLDSSIIDGGNTGRATIDDYTTLSGGVNSIIYGFADIRKTAFSAGASQSAVLIRRAESVIRIYCDKIGSDVGSAIECTNGTIHVSCREMYSTAVGYSGVSCVGSVTIVAEKITSQGPCLGNTGTLVVSADAIESLAAASTVNATSGSLTIKRAKVINNATGGNAIEVANDSLILKDVVVYHSATGLSINAATAKNIRVYGSCITNKATNNITAIVGAVTVDTDVI